MDCMDSLPEGFRAMVPPILILTMAWTLAGPGHMHCADETGGKSIGREQMMQQMRGGGFAVGARDPDDFRQPGFRFEGRAGQNAQRPGQKIGRAHV